MRSTSLQEKTLEPVTSICHMNYSVFRAQITAQNKGLGNVLTSLAGLRVGKPDVTSSYQGRTKLTPPQT